MELEHKLAGEVLIVKPLGAKLDASSAAEFKARMVNWIQKGHKLILLDLSAVEFMDSSGLNAIISVLKALGEEGNIVLCGLRKMVSSVFRLTRMERIFDIYESPREALASQAGRRP